MTPQCMGRTLLLAYWISMALKSSTTTGKQAKYLELMFTFDLSSVGKWLEGQPVHQRDSGSIPKGTYLDCRFDP